MQNLLLVAAVTDIVRQWTLEVETGQVHFWSFLNSYANFIFKFYLHYYSCNFSRQDNFFANIRLKSLSKMKGFLSKI